MTTIDAFKDKTILITGGTGSFGHAFVQMLLEHKRPKKVIILSRDEMKQYEMRKKLNDPCIRYFIGDVRDADRLHRAFHGVDIIIHAAALKIVPTAEYNPFEAIKTNILGAENVINLAIENDVEQVIALSTDKAANPINLYGATKLCAEKMFVAANNYSPHSTKFSVVRYGNVFGSRGSVVPLFKECRKKGIVPITDERMTRFWITLPQGVELVMQSLEEMEGGEIFVPKLPSIRIVDLAEAVCPKCEFEITGIRAGEKVHETLVSADDGLFTYEFDDKFVMYPQVVPIRNNRPKSGILLGANFEGYRSDRNDDWLDTDSLRQILADEEQSTVKPSLISN